MRTKTTIRLTLAGAAAAAAMTLAAPSASAITISGTVPNMFFRTCTAGCSAYVQSNGAYNPSIVSECITKGWFGRVTSDYYKWGRC